MLKKALPYFFLFISSFLLSHYFFMPSENTTQSQEKEISKKKVEQAEECFKEESIVAKKEDKISSIDCSAKVSQMEETFFRGDSDETQQPTDLELETQRVENEKMKLERENYRRIELSEQDKKNKIDRLPRFQYSEIEPPNRYFYGLHLKDYKDIKTFLGKRECSSPHLIRVDNDQRDELLFFNTNINREFSGRAYVINNDYIPVEAHFSFEKFPPDRNVYFYSYEYFSMWIRQPQEKRRFIYGEKGIAENESSDWFYNKCNRSMSLALNECWIDSHYDMGLVDFFYLSKFDLLLANFYCKKSNENKWSRIAYLEFLRTK